MAVKIEFVSAFDSQRKWKALNKWTLEMISNIGPKMPPILDKEAKPQGKLKLLSQGHTSASSLFQDTHFPHCESSWCSHPPPTTNFKAFSHLVLWPSQPAGRTISNPFQMSQYTLVALQAQEALCFPSVPISISSDPAGPLSPAEKQDKWK